MRYNKALECDFCGSVQFSRSKGSFESWIKRIDWLQQLNGNRTTKEFCSKQCYENFKDDLKIESEILGKQKLTNH